MTNRSGENDDFGREILNPRHPAFGVLDAFDDFLKRVQGYENNTEKQDVVDEATSGVTATAAEATSSTTSRTCAHLGGRLFEVVQPHNHLYSLYHAGSVTLNLSG